MHHAGADGCTATPPPERRRASRGREIMLPCCRLLFAASVASVSAATPATPASVKTFGAVGNGQHDDGPAIQRAIDALAANAPDGSGRLCWVWVNDPLRMLEFE